MAQVIQCPTCAKKFKLPDRPPATFTCTGCATVMDLSAFRTAAAAAPEAEPAAAASSGAAASGAGARAGGSATRSARTGGAGSGGGSGSTRTSSARRRARGEEAEGQEAGGGRDFAPPKDNSKALILGSIAGVVVIGLVAFLVLSKKDKPVPPTDAGSGMTTAATGTPLPPPTTAGTTPAPAGTTPAPSTPTPPPTEGGMETAPATDKPPTAPSGPRGPAVVKEVGHHPDATEDEKKNIDHLIDVAIFQNAGRDSKDAEKQLVAIGIKAAPRLINVFNTVKLQEGFENRLGKMKAGIADRALRSIDGYVDRASRGKVTLVSAASDPKFVETIAKRWTMWWENGYYKDPKKPWDERVEGNRGEKADPTDNPATDGEK